MSAPRHARLGRLFLRLRELPPARWSALLNELCPGEPDLRREVLELLETERRPSTELDTPALGEGFHLPELDSLEPEPGPGGRPRRIGSYRIRRALGAGGMGLVYLAEQDHPKRSVALKLLRAGLSTPTARRRFQQEAQLWGRLQHPNIAQVLEAGVARTDQGPRPFLALELVRGSDLAEYAARTRPSQPARIQLLLELCEAIDHAHGRGVLHLDLKPGNVLVDTSGRPRVIDFGLAGLARGASAAAPMGTPRFMSPERLEPSAAGLDRSADVFALGRIAEELLDFNSRLDPEGDLRAIASRATAASKSERYATAGELAADLRRFLAGRPVRAARDSAFYRVRKGVRRHRRGLLAILLLALALAASRPLRDAYRGRELRARSVGERHAGTIAAEREKADRLANYLAGLVVAADPSRLGSDAQLDKVVGRVRGELDEAFGDLPEVEADLRSALARADRRSPWDALVAGWSALRALRAK